MKKFLQEFKDFAMKGNVIDMAVGVIVGGAFSNIVSSLVSDIMTPLISLIIGTVNFQDLKLEVEVGISALGEPKLLTINYGLFLQQVFDFILMAFCLFLFVKALNKMKEETEKLTKKAEEEKATEEPKLSDEAQLLTEIKELLENRK